MPRVCRIVVPGCLALLSCAPKAPVNTGPLLGWHAEEGWPGACYHPPDWEALEEMARRTGRQRALEDMKRQWLGMRGDGVAFDPQAVEVLEVTLLGRPEHIEHVSLENLEHCRQAMTGGDTGDWGAWLAGLHATLMAGECTRPFDYQLVQYMNIQGSWQERIHFCQGDVAVITATEGDRFRLRKGGPWINADGDPAAPATRDSLPCTLEGCLEGMLVGRFTSEDGVVNVFPIGTSLRFVAPAHGYFSIAVNDDTLHDNTWRQKGAVVEHTTIIFTPGE